MRGAIVLAKPEVLLAREAIQHVELRRGERQTAVLVLPVEGEQPRAEGAQVGDVRGPPLDVRARAPAGAHTPREHDLGCVIGHPRGQVRQLGVVEQAVGQVEDALHVGLGRAGTHDLRSRASPQQQVERVREHGLAGAGLAGDGVQPGAEPQLGTLDHKQVFDAKLEQHRPVDSGRPRRIRPAACVTGQPAGAASVAVRSAAGSLASAKSRRRTNRNPRTPPTIATAAPMRRISLSALMNAWLAASAAWA